MNKPVAQLELVPAVAIDVKPEPKTATAEKVIADLEQDEFEQKLWDPNSPEVCIPDQPPIACYENPYGAVVIRQRSTSAFDDDSVVIVRPENIPALIAAMKRYLP
jgi:hypothetical protein